MGRGSSEIEHIALLQLQRDPASGFIATAGQHHEFRPDSTAGPQCGIKCDFYTVPGWRERCRECTLRAVSLQRQSAFMPIRCEVQRPFCRFPGFEHQVCRRVDHVREYVGRHMDGNLVQLWLSFPSVRNDHAGTRPTPLGHVPGDIQANRL